MARVVLPETGHAPNSVQQDAQMTSDLLADLAGQHTELWSLLESLDEPAWQRPSPCDGWDITDVVLHLHQTDELALASLRGELSPDLAEFMRAGGDSSVDDAAAASVVHARGGSGPDVGARWYESAARVRFAFDGVDPSTRLQWIVGRLSARTLAATRLAECWIHTGDVANALGVELAPTERLRHIARLAWRTLPYAFARSGAELAGPVGFELVGPSGRRWDFGLDDHPVTVVSGSGAELCEVAGRRRDPASTGLTVTGPDSDSLLSLVRTYA